jgi:uncharacterized protein with PQ loop repeat
MLEISGIIGAVLFAFCGLPQAIECVKYGNSDGLSWTFLIMWFFGEIFTIAYILPKNDYILLGNYLMNFVFLLIMLKYKIKPRR